MESDNYATIQDVPKPDMTWLIGRTIIEVEKIEFMNVSCGYESWRTVHGEQEVICIGGGGFMEFGRS